MEKDKLQTIVEAVEPDDGTVEHRSTDGSGRITFTYDDLVHAHLLPDEYEIVGFGSRWFAIK